MVLNRQRILRLLGVTTFRASVHEICCARRATGDIRSFFRLATDVILYRILRLGGFGLLDRERTIQLRNGATVTYRLNRGDIQSIREVWFDEAYRLPFKSKVGSVVDLGANIGLTSLYFAETYGASMIVAVEPNRANAILAKRNLEQNGIAARVVEAAIGPFDGDAYFADATDSNLGALSNEGRHVRMVSMPTLCREQRMKSIDLLKMDIEGGEQALLSGGIEWLDDVQAVIAEFHPRCVDYPGLADRIARSGFSWIPFGTVHAHTTDAFIRYPAAGSELETTDLELCGDAHLATALDSIEGHI